MAADSFYHLPDKYCTIAWAAEYLGVSAPKIKKMIKDDLLIWEQRKDRKSVYVEVASLVRAKYPDTKPHFEKLAVKDAIELQRQIDIARHKIGLMANVPPGAVKICFDLG